MADEARVTASLQIRKTGSDGNAVLEYQSRPSSFVADVTGVFGPTPGAVTISRFGTQIDLSALHIPGLCRFMNMDENNPIKVGIYDPDAGNFGQPEFKPFMRLLPGEMFVIRLDPDITEEYLNTGTGTTGDSDMLWAIAENADAVLLVEAFEN